MSGGFKPGSVDLRSFRLGGVDVRARIRNFSIFEHVLKPYTSIVCSILDNVGMIDSGVQGQPLTLSFGQPGQDPYVASFIVTGLERVRESETQRMRTYALTGYSPHMMLFPRVQRSYRERTGTDVARDIVESFLSPVKPVVVRSPSRGVFGSDHMPYTVNGVQVYKAIRAVLDRCVSTSDPSAYVLFENNKNMVIDTLLGMRDRALSNPVATYYRRPMGIDWMADQVMQNFNILKMREDARADMTQSLQDVSQVVNPFDAFSHDLNRVVTGIESVVSSSLNVLYDAMRPPTHLASVMADRKSSASDFDAQSITIQVPLNPEVTVGSGFAVRTLSPAGDTGEPTPDTISGSLLATEVRHTVDMMAEAIQGLTTVRGTRGGSR